MHLAAAPCLFSAEQCVLHLDTQSDPPWGVPETVEDPIERASEAATGLWAVGERARACAFTGAFEAVPCEGEMIGNPLFCARKRVVAFSPPSGASLLMTATLQSEPERPASHLHTAWLPTISQEPALEHRFGHLSSGWQSLQEGFSHHRPVKSLLQ